MDHLWNWTDVSIQQMFFADNPSSYYGPWMGTITVGVAGDSTFYGVYYASPSNPYWGSLTTTGGTGPVLKGFQYDTVANKTYITFYSTLSGDPSQILFEFNGVDTQHARESAGLYWSTGDFFGLSTKVGNTYDAAVTAW